MNLITFETSQNQSKVIIDKMDKNQMLFPCLEVVDDYKQKEAFGKKNPKVDRKRFLNRFMFMYLPSTRLCDGLKGSRKTAVSR